MATSKTIEPIKPENCFIQISTKKIPLYLKSIEPVSNGCIVEFDGEGHELTSFGVRDRPPEKHIIP